MPEVIVMDKEWFVSYKPDEYLEATLPCGDRIRLTIGDDHQEGDPMSLQMARSRFEGEATEKWGILGHIEVGDTEALSMLFAQATKKWVETQEMEDKPWILTRLFGILFGRSMPKIEKLQKTPFEHSSAG